MPKLEEVQALLSHRAPARELAEVFDQALDLLREKLLTRRYGSGAGPL